MKKRRSSARKGTASNLRVTVLAIVFVGLFSLFVFSWQQKKLSPDARRAVDAGELELAIMKYMLSQASSRNPPLR